MLDEFYLRLAHAVILRAVQDLDDSLYAWSKSRSKLDYESVCENMRFFYDGMYDLYGYDLHVDGSEVVQRYAVKYGWKG